MRSAAKWTAMIGSLAICAFACSSTNSNNAQTACTSSYDALIAASDYSSSALGGCDLPGSAGLPFAGVDLGKDPTLATSSGRSFFIARDQDTIFELDAHCATPRAKYGASEPDFAGYANPQDLAVTAAGDLWVPRFNVPTLLILDKVGNRVATIDLSSHDPDGNPNMNAIRIANVAGVEKAFVALERLDDKTQFSSTSASSIVRIDVARHAVEAEITLRGRDPFGAIAENAGAFFLAAPGSFDIADEKDAGIERFDPATSSTIYLLGEANLGGSATEVAVNGSCGAAIVADPTHAVNATSLITFDADQGTPITTAKNSLLATAGFDLAALAWHGDVLMVGDRRRTDNGYPIHLFDRSGVCDLKERADTIFVSQKPVAIRAVQ